MATRGRVILTISVGALLAAFVFYPRQEVPPQPYPLALVWREAYQHRLPEYPHESIVAGHQGLAVAALWLNADGSLRHFSVVQAPDEAIQKSVLASTQYFRVGPSLLGVIPLRRSKLLYYFLLDQGHARVVPLNDLSQKAELLRTLKSRGP